MGSEIVQLASALRKLAEAEIKSLESGGVTFARGNWQFRREAWNEAVLQRGFYAKSRVTVSALMDGTLDLKCNGMHLRLDPNGVWSARRGRGADWVVLADVV